MKDYLESITTKLKPEDFSNLDKNLTRDMQQTSQQFGLPYSNSRTTQQSETLSLFPQQQQLQSGTIGVSNLAGLYGPLPFITDNSGNKYYPQDGKRLDQTNPEHQIIINQEIELKKLLGMGDETEIYNHLNKNIGILSKNPFAYIYLTYPLILNWLTNTDNGKKFVSLPQNIKILDNIKMVLNKQGGSSSISIINILNQLSIEGQKRSTTESVIGDVAKDLGMKQLPSALVASLTPPK
jgi:hypothetical protein